MAKKSKTQRAKASANRAAKKAQTEETPNAVVEESVEAEAPKKERKLPFKKKADDTSVKSSEVKFQPKAEKKTAEKKAEKPAKKPGFLSEVRSELKRVTWPTGQDVARWSGVVVAALVFFGVYVLILDNWVVTPILVAISNLGV